MGALTVAGTFLKSISFRTWAIIGGVLLVILIAWRVYAAVISYGDTRENDGVLKERAAWEEADRQLQIKAAKAKTEADASAAKREARHAQEVAEERKEINEAYAEGRSPFDVLFGS
jgi:hypothetical protein